MTGTLSPKNILPLCRLQLDSPCPNHFNLTHQMAGSIVVPTTIFFQRGRRLSSPLRWKIIIVKSCRLCMHCLVASLTSNLISKMEIRTGHLSPRGNFFVFVLELAPPYRDYRPLAKMKNYSILVIISAVFAEVDNLPVLNLFSLHIYIRSVSDTTCTS